MYIGTVKIFGKYLTVNSHFFEYARLTLWLTLVRSHHLQWKFKLLAGKFTWGDKAKHCWVMSKNTWKQINCWQNPAMFCLYTLSNLSCTLFEFSLKVMGLNPGYLLKSFYFTEPHHMDLMTRYASPAECWKCRFSRNRRWWDDTMAKELATLV